MHYDDPRAAALRVLDWCFAQERTHVSGGDGARASGGAPDRDQPAGARAASQMAGLEPFQLRAAARLDRIINARGGAILADSVGLGKTHVALALIHAEIAAGGTSLVVAPAQLRTHWERHLRRIPQCTFLSHTALSRASRAPRQASLVVVDEAHAFRNARTRRYAALALLCERARVLLLTATPVNNSLLDFYHLVRLFAARDDFADLGVPDLLAAVDAAVHGAAGSELRRVSSAIMVRRTREAATRMATASVATSDSATRHALIATPRGRLSFPARAPLEVLRYDMAASSPELRACVLRVLPTLTFPAHTMAARAPAQLMQLALLKRLESSMSAFRSSVRRHIRILEQFADAARDGLLLDPSLASMRSAEVHGAVQLSLGAVALRPWPGTADRELLAAAAAADLRALHELHRLMAVTPNDSKLASLTELLHATNEKLLLFTAYSDTAHAIWNALAKTPGVALITGGDARLGRLRSGRRTIMERFAPLANGVRPPRPAEDVRILIATDVLSEGMNLQDASVAVSYDLPWNPVRLSQRFGRIDRLGSPHARIRMVVFTPDHGIDDLLGLMKRLRRKLRQIRVVGGDAPWSLGRTRPTARLMDDVASIDAARERALEVWTAARCRNPPPGMPRPAGVDARLRTTRPQSRPPPPPGPPLVSAALWPRDHHAALCCFAAGIDVLPVLVSDGRPADAGTAAAWTALSDVAAGTLRPARLGAAALADLAAAAWIAAHRALHRRPRSGKRRTGSDPASPSGKPGAVIMRWLATRPGGATPPEVERADALLRSLRSGGNAGASIRMARAVSALTRQDDATDDGHAPRIPASTDSPRGTPAGPRPLAVILLRSNAR